MIRVIDGKRYNTETATKIFSHWNGCSRSDFQYRTKALFRTVKGKWFLHHYGGAMTDMAVSAGNNGRTGSESIEPIDESDALGFLEAHSDDSEAAAAIETHFADQVEEA